MSQQPKKDNFTKFLVIGIVVVVAAMMVIPTVISKTKKSELVIPSTVSTANGYGITFNGDVAGVPKVDIWEDFQCPICQQFEIAQSNYIKSLIKDKKAQVTFHMLSFIGEESVRAAGAAACAADEGKFIDFHNALYANQSSTENSGAWSNDQIIEIAKSVGITGAKFEKCVTDEKYNTWVSEVAKSGVKEGVNSTPTVFINGKEIDRNTEYFSPEKFKAAVERG